MSAYATEVEKDSPLGYWKLAENSGAPAVGGKTITLNGTVSEATGPLEKGDEGATSFDGSNDFGQVAIDLSAQTSITLEFWLKWDAYAADDDLAMEYTASTNSGTGGFYIDPNNSNGGGNWQIKTRLGNVDGTYRTNSRPSAGAWHHVVVVLRLAEAPIVYFDAAEAGLTIEQAPFTQTGTFANSTLNLMCRNAAAIFGAGDMAHLAIYSGVLSKARVEAHFAARSEEGGKTINLEFNESIGINETHADRDSKVLADAIALGESHQTSTRKAIEDKVALTDTLARTLGISRKEAVAISDTLTIATQHVMHQDDTITLTDALTRAWTALRILTDSFTVTDAMKTSTAKLLEDSIVLAELHHFTLSMNFTEGFSITDTIEVGKVLAVSIDDSFSLVEDLRRDWRARRTVEEVIAVADEMQRTWQARPVFAEAIVITDSIEVLRTEPLRYGSGSISEARGPGADLQVGRGPEGELRESNAGDAKIEDE